MFFIVPITLVAVLSFFPWVEERVLIEGTRVLAFDNAKWIVLTISIVEIILLFIENRWTNDLYKVLSVVTFLVTLFGPIYYTVNYGADGWNPIFQHNSTGIVVLIVSIIPYVGFKIYEIVKKRNTGSV